MSNSQKLSRKNTQQSNKSKSSKAHNVSDEIKNSRYKLHQFYQSKFNEKRIKGELEYNKPNQISMFTKDSLLMQRLSQSNNDNNIEELISNGSDYVFERDLFDNKYQERLKNFNLKRKKNPVHYSDNVINITNSLNTSYVNSHPNFGNINNNTIGNLSNITTNSNINTNSNFLFNTTEGNGYRTEDQNYSSGLTTNIPVRFMKTNTQNNQSFENPLYTKDLSYSNTPRSCCRYCRSQTSD